MGLILLAWFLVTTDIEFLTVRYSRTSHRKSPYKSSTNKDNLSAEYCDDDGNCEPCENTISCGYFTPWTTWSDCSVSCSGGIQTREREFISDTIVSDIEIEERECNTDPCPTWGKWRPWSSCSAQCWQSGQPEPIQSRYRCWKMADGTKNCGSGKAEPGQGQLCGRASSELCYETTERNCNTGKEFETILMTLIRVTVAKYQLSLLIKSSF